MDQGLHIKNYRRKLYDVAMVITLYRIYRIQTLQSLFLEVISRGCVALPAREILLYFVTIFSFYSKFFLVQEVILGSRRCFQRPGWVYIKPITDRMLQYWLVKWDKNLQ